MNFLVDVSNPLCVRMAIMYDHNLIQAYICRNMSFVRPTKVASTVTQKLIALDVAALYKGMQVLYCLQLSALAFHTESDSERNRYHNQV